jgi:signal transduction histidine kinase
VIKSLSPEEEILMEQMIRQAGENTQLVSAKDLRTIKKRLNEELRALNVHSADDAGDTLSDIGIHHDVERYIKLLLHPKKAEILQIVYAISGLRRNSSTIASAVNRAAKIIFALKSYSRSQQNSEPEITDVAENIETVLTLYQNQIRQGVEVVRNYHSVPKILAYPEELYQVWTNIIHNALQAMSNKGTLTIEVRPENSTQSGKEGVAVLISDTGPGIPTDIIENIFQPFFTTKSAGEGTGLGLDISKKIVETHHSGSIEAENKSGGGAQFTVRLGAQ